MNICTSSIRKRESACAWIMTGLVIISYIAVENVIAKEVKIEPNEVTSRISTSPIERIRWQRIPISITLPVGRERLVTFPHPVRVGVPGSIESKLRTQSVDGTVYWLAHTHFGLQRVQIQNLETGALILVDLKAVPASQASSAPIEIVVDRNSKDGTIRSTKQTQRKSDARRSRTRAAGTRALDYVVLTRYVAQQLYAPARLLKTLSGVVRIRISPTPVCLIRGQSIEAVPLIAWRSGTLTITAVRLRNLEPHPVTLDPRDLRGEWRAATFQHARLFPAGHEADTTAVYLIADRPFREAL